MATELQIWPRGQELLDLVRPREAAATAKRPAIERRYGVGVREHVFDIAARVSQTTGDKSTAKGVAGARAVDAIHRKSGGADFAAVAPRQAAVGAERGADERCAELACDRFERPAQTLVSGQRGRKLLRSDNRIDVLKEIADAGPDLFDVDYRRDSGAPRVPRRLSRRGRFMTIHDQHPS